MHGHAYDKAYSSKTYTWVDGFILNNLDLIRNL